MKRLLLACAASLIALGAAHAEIPSNTLKVGVLTDMSGPFADQAGRGSVTAAQMAAEDFAKEDPSAKVEIVSADHQNKPDVGAAIVRNWLDRDGVDAVVDVPNSGVGLAVNTVVHEKNRTFMGSAIATSDLTGKFCQDTTVQWALDTWALGNAVGTAVVKAGGNKWYFLSFEYALGQALERDTRAAIDKLGATVVGSVHHPLGTDGFLLLPAAGAELGRERARPRRYRHGCGERGQAGAGIRHPAQGRDAGRAVHADLGCRGARLAGGAGHDPVRALLLGPQ